MERREKRRMGGEWWDNGSKRKGGEERGREKRLREERGRKR